ncbi:TonB-dependent receptor SusC, partial [termite gut metagenome]
MKNPFIYLFIFLSMNVINMYGQEYKSVSGKVSDSKGEPLIGVNILEVGTNNGTITDLDGQYNLKISPNAKLQFNYIGYKKLEISVGNQSIINATLEEELSELDEIVVVGYGTVKRRDLTGSITSISSKKIIESPVVSAAEAIQGKVPGVLVSNSNWTPGATPSILIRGKRSINASNDPLYVVDGIPISTAPNLIAPGDIESIDVL